MRQLPPEYRATVERMISSAIESERGKRKNELREALNHVQGFRAQRDTANPKSSIETATKASAGAGMYLSLGGGTLTGTLNTLAVKIGGNVGFYGTSPQPKGTVTGSKGGNAALSSLLTVLAGYGLLTDSST